LTDPLESTRAAAAERVVALRRELADVISSASSTTGDDEHDPEGATIGFERAQAQALLDQAVAALADLDAALERQRAGAYGSCAECGRPIGTERLAARPAALRCIACESSRRR